MKKAAFWLAVILVVAVLYIMPRMVEQSIPSMYYVTPNQTTYETVVSCTGTVQAAQVREVYLSTPAVPAAVNVQVGDTVEAGQVVAVLDLEKTQAVAPDSMDLMYRLSQQGLLGQDLSGIDWESVASLYGASALLGGSFDLNDLGSLLGGTDSAVEVTGSWVDSLDREIRAPISGVVTSLQLREDIPASAGTSVLTIADQSSYRVTATVGEADIAKVHVGNRAEIRCTGYASKLYMGTVTSIAPTARKVLSGTSTETVVDVEIELLSGDDMLKPGFTARVEVKGGEDYELITVPYEAIRQDENNDEYVYVYEDGKVVRASVMTGQELTNEVEVLYGLDRDAIVLFNPGDQIREGMMIQLRGRANVS